MAGQALLNAFDNMQTVGGGISDWWGNRNIVPTAAAAERDLPPGAFQQPAPASAGLQPGPAEVGPSPPLEQPGRPALGAPDPRTGEPPEIDPAAQDEARKALSGAASRANKMPPKEKKQLEKAVVDAAGGEKAIDKEYSKLIEQLGGLKDLEKIKLTSAEKGIAILDFGLRMMAAGGAGQNVPLAMGTAGQGALQGAQGVLQGRREQAQAQNQATQQGALGVLERREAARAKEGGLDQAGWETEYVIGPDGQTVVGRANPRTGQVQPSQTPEGAFMRPGQDPGTRTSTTDYQRRYGNLLDVLPGTDEEKRRQATFILEGARTPAEERQRWAEIIADWASEGIKVTAPGQLGKKKVDQWTEAEKKSYIDKQVDRSWGKEFSWDRPGLD